MGQRDMIYDSLYHVYTEFYLAFSSGNSACFKPRSQYFRFALRRVWPKIQGPTLEFISNLKKINAENEFFEFLRQRGRRQCLMAHASHCHLCLVGALMVSHVTCF